MAWAELHVRSLSETSMLHFHNEMKNLLLPFRSQLDQTEHVVQTRQGHNSCRCGNCARGTVGAAPSNMCRPAPAQKQWPEPIKMQTLISSRPRRSPSMRASSKLSSLFRAFFASGLFTKDAASQIVLSALSVAVGEHGKRNRHLYNRRLSGQYRMGNRTCSKSLLLHTLLSVAPQQAPREPLASSTLSIRAPVAE